MLDDAGRLLDAGVDEWSGVNQGSGAKTYAKDDTPSSISKRVLSTPRPTYFIQVAFIQVFNAT
jgi:hypothetical protein